MTDLEILKKAIKKAMKNDYNPYSNQFTSTPTFLTEGYPCVIFSHEFAKAFWEEFYCVYCKNESPTWIGGSCPACGRSKYNQIGWRNTENWKYHLSKMVLEKEPLKYLEGFLNDKTK